MSEEEKKPIVPLTKEEKDILEAYSAEVVVVQKDFARLKSALDNLVKVALYGRGLSPETHKINDTGEIIEVKSGEVK